MLSTNSQPSKSLFGNNKNAQRGSSAGNLFANSSSQRSGSSIFPVPPKSSLFQEIPNPFQRSAPPASKEVPIYGTVDYIGKSHVHRTPENYSFVCITGTIKNCSLDELRIQDYYNTRRNLLPPSKKQLVDTTIFKNNSKRTQGEFMSAFNPFEGQNNPFLSGGICRRNPSSSQKATGPQNSQPSNVFGGATQDLKSIKNLFADPKSMFKSATQPPKTSINPYLSQHQAAKDLFRMKPTQNNQALALQNPRNLFEQTQSKENIPNPKKQEPSPQPVQKTSDAKPKEEVSEKQGSVGLKSGSFSYEVNKMVLVSSFISLLQNHKVPVPGDLLDNTDFVSQLFKLLEEYDLKLPTENIPQFPLNTLTSLSNKPRISEGGKKISSKRRRRRRKNSKKASQKSSDEKYQEKSTKMKAPLKEVLQNVENKEEVEKKEVSFRAIDRKKLLWEDDSPFDSEKEEEKEKVEIKDETVKVPKCEFQDDDEENVVQSLEKDNSESGVVSVNSSVDNSSYEECVKSLYLSECEKRKKEIVFEI